MRLEVRHLELLLTIDREASISGAARALGTVQPHVSRMLARIEHELGFPVFERGKYGTRPTADGEEVLREARRAIDAVQQLQEAPEPGARRELRLLCHAFNGAELVAPLRAARPELDVTLLWTDPEPGFAELAAGTADVLVGLRLPYARWPQVPDVVESEIVTDPTVVFLPSDHPLSGVETLDLKDLADADWITGEDPLSQQMLIAECRSAGGFEPRLRYFANEGNLVRSLLTSGLAVILGSSVAPRAEGFVARPYRNATPATWVLACRRDRAGDDVLDDVARIARQVYEAMREQAGAGDTDTAS